MKQLVLAIAITAGISNFAMADDALKAAISAANRTPANVERDSARHPYETLSFFGITPKMTVIEFSPGGGWYTEILAPYLRNEGKLIAGASPRFKAKLDTIPAVYDKVVLANFDASGKLDYSPKNSADMVLTFRNVHNWVSNGDAMTKNVFQSAFDALKPGGVFGVVEHRLPAAKAQDAKASSGYMHEAFVIKVAESVGFKLLAKSEINANPKDDAEHESGVWALPPVLANKEKDKAKYQAIGESDRMTLKFVKP
jgi:predicted methyltransferase